MHKIVSQFALLLVIGSMVACNSNERTTESGLTYTVLREGSGEVAQESQYIALNMKYGTEDSTWIDTGKENLPMLLMKRKAPNISGATLQDILYDLKLGDSVQFEVSLNDLFTKTWRRPVPPTMDSAAVVKFNVGVEAIMDQATMQQWQADQKEKISANQLNYDVELIEKYLQENDIEATKTESGLHYVILEEGEGDRPNEGDSVVVNYAGYNLEGVYFDTSFKELAEEKGIYNPQREPYGPLEFPIGRRAVISGWDEGIQLLNTGAKARLFVPSTLAYGKRALSQSVGPNSILLFDVELVEIKN